MLRDKKASKPLPGWVYLPPTERDPCVDEGAWECCYCHKTASDRFVRTCGFPCDYCGGGP